MPPDLAVSVDHVDLTYPTHPHPTPAVLRDVQLSVPVGEHVAVIGRSGCGKSTLLHLIGGLLRPTSGTVRVLDGSREDARLTHCALMPQGDSLLPWFSVQDNVAVALRNRGIGRREARSRADTMLERCGLAGQGRSRPDRLSGGMRQRAALARALLAEKPVLLADEPLGALDAITRGEIQDWLASLLAGSGTTMIMVTHDVDEALLLAHRVVLLDRGTVAGTWPGWFSRRAGRSRAEVLADPEFAASRAGILDHLGSTPGAAA
ncbi:ABC transporter ATP-binding protein [Corynebacterium terpenotabidum]|uniref:ABC transporter ATP-binding protein n=1 Tax=Corynebacterium terpenotabidum Y-11 TaxID=1200352 RepID=S4XBL6_9CORY|nr:ATP-binding cassette domain-containing protein [Corynebacterium terpenotabidum]AGP29966.1 ABC transporter ATP-binding protein [Corynebacterium terpenotabidum Y-11]